GSAAPGVPDPVARGLPRPRRHRIPRRPGRDRPGTGVDPYRRGAGSRGVGAAVRVLQEARAPVTGTQRLFVAVDLPSYAVDHLTEITQGLHVARARARARLAAPERWHITL